MLVELLVNSFDLDLLRLPLLPATCRQMTCTNRRSWHPVSVSYFCCFSLRFVITIDLSAGHLVDEDFGTVDCWLCDKRVLYLVVEISTPSKCVNNLQ